MSSPTPDQLQTEIDTINSTLSLIVPAMNNIMVYLQFLIGSNPGDPLPNDAMNYILAYLPVLSP